MNQTFKYNGLTITVRPKTGVDMIDNPVYNGIVMRHVTGETEAKQVSTLIWNRLATYVSLWQTSTIEGKGLKLPELTAPDDEIGEGYNTWIAFIAGNPQCYELWNEAYRKANKEDSDPQPESAETKPDAK